MPLNNTVSVILPGVVIAVAAIVVFLADLFLKRKTALPWIAVAGLLCGAAVAIGQWGEWTARFAVWRVFTGGLTFGRREATVGFAGHDRARPVRRLRGRAVLRHRRARGAALRRVPGQAAGRARRVLRPAAPDRHRHGRHGDQHRHHRLLRQLRAHVAADVHPRRLHLARPEVHRGVAQVLRHRRLLVGDPRLRARAALRRDRRHQLRRHRHRPRRPAGHRPRRRRLPRGHLRAHRHRLRLQGLGRAVPQLGAGRLRGRPHPRHGLHGHRRQGGRLHRVRQAVLHGGRGRVGRLGPRHDHPGDPHDGGGERPRAAAAQPQAHARLLEHRPRRLPHAGHHRRRQERRHAWASARSSSTSRPTRS